MLEEIYMIIESVLDKKLIDIQQKIMLEIGERLPDVKIVIDGKIDISSAGGPKPIGIGKVDPKIRSYGFYVKLIKVEWNNGN
jgi:hypothetical protein